MSLPELHVSDEPEPMANTEAEDEGEGLAPVPAPDFKDEDVEGGDD